MTGEPSAKRQRTEEPAPEELERVQKVLEQVEEVNAELEAADAALAKEVLAIERKFNKTKAPTFAKRNALLEQVPGLWKQALSNHPLLAASIDEQDELILEHATSLDVEFLEDNNGSYKLALTLKENPFLANKTVWKQIVFSEDDEGEDQVTASGLEWKDTDEAKEAKEGASFLSWLASAEGDHELAEFIKDEVWKHPVQLYLSRDSDDEDDDEEGEGEDGDEEEGDEEEEEAAEE